MTQARNLSRLLNKDITTYMYTATAGQTVFTGSDTNSQTLAFDNQSIMVTYNGVMLEKGSEFTVAANTVTLLAGAEVNAEVNVIVFNNASLGGYVKSTGGDIDGGVNITNGNLLVGKTTSSLAPNGAAFFTTGQSDYSSDAAYVSKFNKKGADGTILEFRKDTTTVVGSIGNDGSDTIFIGSGNVAVAFQDGANAVTPWNTAGGVSDNVMDLGRSLSRFKDAYLSGGVYLGGTGSANKLDDYEEGTWNPVLNGTSGNATMGTGTVGFYTKVGNLVHVTGTMIISGNGNNANDWTKITGMPFAVNGNGGARQVGVIGAWTGCNDSEKITLVADPSNTFMYVIRRLNTTYAHNNTFANTGNLYGFSLVYQTA